MVGCLSSDGPFLVQGHSVLPRHPCMVYVSRPLARFLATSFYHSAVLAERNIHVVTPSLTY